jgi:ribosomal protein S18 acetylase RimI-like enzyme
VIEIRAADSVDSQALLDHVVSAWGGESVVGHGEEMYPASLPGFVALEDGTIVGHASYRIDGDRCELVSIDSDKRHAGTGTLLIDAVVETARSAGCSTVWLTTTNDNLDALRFYQRRGFRLTELRTGALAESRRLKPEIPEVGSYGIPMRDELDLELPLRL